MKATGWRRGLLCGLAVAMLLTTTGCTDRAALMELAALFLPEILAYKAFGSTGNEAMDAVLQAKSVLDQIGAADAKMDEGREKGDPELMEEAIALRPKDPTYRVDAAGLYLAQDDVKAAERHLSAAELAVPNNPNAKMNHALQVIDQFEAVKEKGDAQGYASLEQCKYVHNQLVIQYDRQWKLTGHEGTSPAGSEISREGDRCAGLVKP